MYYNFYHEIDRKHVESQLCGLCRYWSPKMNTSYHAGDLWWRKAQSLVLVYKSVSSLLSLFMEATCLLQHPAASKWWGCLFLHISRVVSCQMGQLACCSPENQPGGLFSKQLPLQMMTALVQTLDKTKPIALSVRWHTRYLLTISWVTFSPDHNYKGGCKAPKRAPLRMVLWCWVCVLQLSTPTSLLASPWFNFSLTATSRGGEKNSRMHLDLKIKLS